VKVFVWAYTAWYLGVFLAGAAGTDLLCAATAAGADTTGLLNRSVDRTGCTGDSTSDAALRTAFLAATSLLPIAASRSREELMELSPRRTIVSASLRFAQSASSLDFRSSCSRSSTRGCCDTSRSKAEILCSGSVLERPR
jgi:hypothetical protein